MFEHLQRIFKLQLQVIFLIQSMKCTLSDLHHLCLLGYSATVPIQKKFADMERSLCAHGFSFKCSEQVVVSNNSHMICRRYDC